MMRRQALAVFVPVLLAGHAIAQPARNAPPPKFHVQLDQANVDRALIETARAGKINIIADATDWPAATKTLTTSHDDSTLGWMGGLANEFDLTFNGVGAKGGSDWLPLSTRNFVVWREPDVGPLLQQARELMAAPTVLPQPAIAPMVREEGEPESEWNTRLMRQQQAQAQQDLVAFLRLQNGEGRSINRPRDYPLSQIPTPLRDSLRQLARVTTANWQSIGLLGRLDDEAWKNARLKMQYVAGEGQAYLVAHTSIKGEATMIEVATFRPQ